MSNTVSINMIQSSIKFLKVREVKSPTRANKYDAGIDFYVPEFTQEFMKVLCEKNSNIQTNFTHDYPPVWEYIILKPQERILIPSGIHCQMESPYRALIAANKSGVATKYGLIFGAEVVDYEYQGEIHLSIINTSNEDVKITPGMKMLQFLETPVYHSEIEIEEGKTTEEFYKETTTRGAGGFGSSDQPK